MLTINADTIDKALTFPKLVDALHVAFTESIHVPPRLHYDMENPKASRETTLLMMPAWQAGDVAGIKLVTVAPENSQKDLPSIQGTYLLLDVDTGSMKAMLDAPLLTAKRTAAASALASRFLSRQDSQRLLIIGTGTLATHLIEAHISVRPIKQVYVWGRNIEKAQKVCQQVAHLGIDCIAVEDLEFYVKQADIISCATLSTQALVFGDWLKEGQHLDMVGAYRPDMREMDNHCLTRANIFVDNVESAIRETGDLAIPLQENVITTGDIKADLFALCNGEYSYQRNENDITLFKSVGHALEDLAAAKLVVEYLDEVKRF
ncbi:ornithine cyclodeaminase family protein [Colwelliaceae bacterium 6441]